MITGLTFERFRGFTTLEMAPLQRINLIAGANNTGKTGVLEGLYLLLAADPTLISRLPGAFRNTTPGAPGNDQFITFWQALFFDRQTDAPVSVSSKRDDGKITTGELSDTGGGLALSYGRSGIGGGPAPSPELGLTSSQAKPPKPTVLINSEAMARVLHLSGGPIVGLAPFTTNFITISTRMEQPASDADLYNQVTLLEDGEDRLLQLLRHIDPRLQKLRYAKAPGTSQPLVYAHFGLKNALCITQTGQGFSKLFSLFCQMLVSKAQVLLIDEIENGVYYETLPAIWRGLAVLAASEKIQVFATTHSRECITAAHETMKTMPSYDFALHRLQRVNGRIEAITHDQEMLEVALKSGGGTMKHLERSSAATAGGVSAFVGGLISLGPLVGSASLSLLYSRLGRCCRSHLSMLGYPA